MFHGDLDVNVPIDHSEKLDEALRKAGGSSRLVIYDGADHSLQRDTFRIDMLDELGGFLDRHTAPRRTSWEHGMGTSAEGEGPAARRALLRQSDGTGPP